jgi:DNA-binding transcriptional ArsR family regulator
MIKEIDKLKAASDETRLRILRLLIKAQAEICVCHIVGIIKKPQYNISKSLSILKKAGLIEERRLGRFMMYKLKYDDQFNKAFFDSISLLDNEGNAFTKDDANLKEFMSSDKIYGPDKCCNR